MRGAAPWAAGLVASLALGGCLGGSDAPRRHESSFPPGWDEEAPARSELATKPYYDLSHSTSFLLKGASYGRYVVRVTQALTDAQIFFSTTNVQSTGRAPQVDDPDAYHFEFIQWRPLGQEVHVADVEALPQFRHAAAEDQFTLTYIYGHGVDVPFLAPYDGNPDHWRIDPGYYEVVIATDEKLTVGFNVRTDSPYWSTLYHPQELGEARAEALDFAYRSTGTVGGKLPDVERELHGLVVAAAGERFHYFTFADVWYDTQVLAVDATATATVTVDGEELAHRLALTSPSEAQDEAYAFATHFNGPGPAHVDLRSHAVFRESLSAQSRVVVVLLIFGVALIPLHVLAGLPTSAEL